MRALHTCIKALVPLCFVIGLGGANLGCSSMTRVVRSDVAEHRRPVRTVNPASVRVELPQFSADGGSAETAYAFYDGATGRTLSFADVLHRARRADVVVLGEQHDQAAHHELQRRLVSVLASKAPGLVVGLEMLPWPVQPVLDRYNDGELDASQLAAAVDWSRIWGFSFSLYESILTSGRSAGGRFFALNVPRELVKAVRNKGIDGLSRDEQLLVPELDLGDRVHREWFRRLFAQAGHTVAASDVDSYYTAQVVWDEGMAQRAVEALVSGAPQVVVLAGVGHVARGRGIPQRVERRRPSARVLSVVPLTDVDADNVRARVTEAVVDGEGDILVVPRFENAVRL